MRGVKKRSFLQIAVAPTLHMRIIRLPCSEAESGQSADL